jgi:hypothetical protein
MDNLHLTEQLKRYLASWCFQIVVVMLACSINPRSRFQRWSKLVEEI